MASSTIDRKTLFLGVWGIQGSLPICSNKSKKRIAITFYVIALLSAASSVYYAMRGPLPTGHKITFIAHPIVSFFIGKSIWLSQILPYQIGPTIYLVQNGLSNQQALLLQSPFDPLVGKNIRWTIDKNLQLKEEDVETAKASMGYLDFFVLGSGITIRIDNNLNERRFVFINMFSENELLIIYNKNCDVVSLNFEESNDGGLKNLSSPFTISQWFSASSIG